MPQGAVTTSEGRRNLNVLLFSGSLVGSVVFALWKTEKEGFQLFFPSHDEGTEAWLFYFLTICLLSHFCLFSLYFLFWFGDMQQTASSSSRLQLLLVTTLQHFFLLIRRNKLKFFKKEKKLAEFIWMASWCWFLPFRCYFVWSSFFSVFPSNSKKKKK